MWWQVKQVRPGPRICSKVGQSSGCEQPGVPILEIWSQSICIQSKPSFESKHFCSCSSDHTHLVNTRQTNSTEFQVKSPPTRPIPFCVITFLHRALTLFWDITKKSLIWVIFPMWSKSHSWKVRWICAPKEGIWAWSKHISSACPQIAGHHQCSFSAWCSFSLYVMDFEKREEFWLEC